MAKLTTKERDKLPKSEFGLKQGGKEKYPMPDKGHARAAKSRASEEENKGNISKSQESKIDAKADRILGRSKTKAK